MTAIRPKITVLDSENIESIYQKAIIILENPGIKVEAESASQKFLKELGNSAVNVE
jgi:trimethylamine:corrinoid methyltransferase-like protein